MALTTLAVSGYRSLRDVTVGLAPLTVVTGANGTGKSNLYRALRLLADVAHGRLIGSLAAEGGLPSTLWAGPETFSRAMQRGDAPVQGTVRGQSVSLKLGFGSEDFGYAVDLGLPVGGHSAFALDPVIKRECLWAGPVLQSRIGTRTTALANDGGDLAAAIQTIREIGDHAAFDAAVADAFPGASVAIDVADGRFALRFSQTGLLRPLAAAELSDGTLRYLLWTAALLSPRPPELLVLNEPETSLHPDLLPALGRLIAAASCSSQLLVVTHSTRLAAALDETAGCHRVVLSKALSETRVVRDDVDGAEDAKRPAWHWPQR